MACSYSLQVIDSTDFDVDGFNDAILRVGQYSSVADADHPIAMILYGAPDGLPEMSPDVTFSANRVSKIYDTRPRAVNTIEVLGDVNGDGGADIAFGHVGQSIAFSTPGRRSANIVLPSHDGLTGVQWPPGKYPNPFMNNPTAVGIPGTDSTGDWDGDGIDDYFSRGRFIRGYAPFRTENDVTSLFVWSGPDSSTARWVVPDDASNVSSFKVVYNDIALATLDSNVTRYMINHSVHDTSGRLRIQSLDENGMVIGERAKWIGSLGSEYVESEALNRAESELGERISATTYTLSGIKYGATLGELFWNETKQIVLIWRDNDIVGRTDGNSFVINPTDHGSGNYFLTVDYFGGIPSTRNPLENIGGTLERSNLVTISFK